MFCNQEQGGFLMAEAQGVPPAQTDRLAYWTAPQTAALRESIVLLATGSLEQHGPHLPIGTDTLIVQAVANSIAERLEGVLVAEPLPYGCSWHHTRFSGTATLRPSTFIAILVDVCRSFSDMGFFPIIVNGHGGNRAPIDVALIELAESERRAAAFTYFDLLEQVAHEAFESAEGATGHACALETSMAQFLWPQLVNASAVPSGNTPKTWPDPHMFARKDVSVVRRFDEINPTGVIGRPSAASPDAGRRLFETAVERGVELVDKIAGELK
jgi:creatinine amidohydrolase